MLLPELAEQVKKNQFAEDEFYVYRKGPKSKWVYRIWKPIFNAFSGTSMPWSQIRKVKFYDAAGRLDKNTFGRVLKAMNQNRLPRNRLDQYFQEKK